MVFYDLAGKKLRDTKEFIGLYEPSYLIGGARIPGVSQSSGFTENEIDRILKDGIQSQIDVVHILAWKIGKIKHKDSTSKFVYAKDWKDAEQFQVTRYGKPFDLAQIAEYIATNIKELEEKAKSNPQGVLNDLKNVGTSGLGPVYLVTLLYFVSRGKYPIYDRFAMIAADAILEGKKPGGTVEYHELPYKNSKAFSTIMQTHIQPYIAKLEQIFGCAYQTTRDIDRAMWVYGHLFNR